jgi:hypothetical protein
METQLAESNTGSARLMLGSTIFVSAFAIWLLVPLAATLNVSAARIAALSAALFVLNKILLMVAVAILGKPGFLQIRKRLFGYASLIAPVPIVSPIRHAIGLLMFFVPLLWDFLSQYIDVAAPDLRPNRLEFRLLADLVFVASFFVLGGNFWDKIRALFVRTANVVYSDAR